MKAKCESQRETIENKRQKNQSMKTKLKHNENREKTNKNRTSLRSSVGMPRRAMRATRARVKLFLSDEYSAHSERYGRLVGEDDCATYGIILSQRKRQEQTNKQTKTYRRLLHAKLEPPQLGTEVVERVFAIGDLGPKGIDLTLSRPLLSRGDRRGAIRATRRRHGRRRRG